MIVSDQGGLLSITRLKLTELAGELLVRAAGELQKRGSPMFTLGKLGFRSVSAGR